MDAIVQDLNIYHWVAMVSILLILVEMVSGGLIFELFEFDTVFDYLPFKIDRVPVSVIFMVLPLVFAGTGITWKMIHPKELEILIELGIVGFSALWISYPLLIGINAIIPEEGGSSGTEDYLGTKIEIKSNVPANTFFLYRICTQELDDSVYIICPEDVKRGEIRTIWDRNKNGAYVIE